MGSSFMQLFHSNVSLGEAFGYSILGMAIVFAVLIVLMLVIKVMEKFTAKNSEAEATDSPVPATASAAPAPAAPAKPAPGTAGELKLYNVDERDAAMVMAIVADSLGKPLNELRFISIREVTDQ